MDLRHFFRMSHEHNFKLQNLVLTFGTRRKENT